MVKKNFKKELKIIVKKYFKGEYSESVNHRGFGTGVFGELSEISGNEKLTHAQKEQIEKFMLLFFWVK